MVDPDTQASAFLAVGGGVNKRTKSVVGSSTTSASANFMDDSGMHSIDIGVPHRGLQQGTIPELTKKKDKEFVDKMLTKHFIVNNIAFNVVQTSAFNEFVKAVADYGPGYKLPSYSTLRAKLVPNSRMVVDEYVAKVKESWITTGCTIMSDIWTDMRQRSFINLVAYSPGGAVFMKSLDVSREKKTGIFLKEIVRSVIETIGHEHVVQFVTDNGSNFTAAGDMLLGLYPRMYKIRCAAHGIQLLLKDIYENIIWVRIVIDEAKSIVMFMTRYTILHATMKEFTKDKELKQPCTTRFAYNFLMLQSVLDLENEFRLFVASSEWRGFDYSKMEAGKKVTDIIQSDFWTRGSEVINIMEPLVRVLRLADGDGSTAGYLYEAMLRAKDAIKERSNSDVNKYQRIWELFETRRINNIIHPIHAAAAFLNPGYFYSDKFREDREMKEGINYIHENLLLMDEKESFMRQVQFYRSKPSTLFTPSALTMLKTSHPRIWWDYNGDDLPVLKKYAIRILSQPCSASSCERNWSAFEAAQTKKRNRLSHNMLNTLVYVRMNTMMMDKFTSMVTKDLEPINLDKLGELPDYEGIPRNESDSSTVSATDDFISTSMGEDQPSWLDDYFSD